MTRVQSVSSPPLIFLLLAISVITAAVSVPFWDAIVVFGTVFGIIGSDEVRGRASFLVVSHRTTAYT